MFFFCFLTSIYTLSFFQGKNTGPLLVEAAQNGRHLAVQYFVEQVLTFPTEPVLTELMFLTAPVLTEPSFLTDFDGIELTLTILNRGPTWTPACPVERPPLCMLRIMDT